MSDARTKTPAVHLIRHGETEWAKAGKYTGTTEQPLTDEGIQQAISIATVFVGPGKKLDPERIGHVIVSPRLRALQTLERLGLGPNKLVLEDVAEWDYGNYEGLKRREIVDLRRKQGLGEKWSVWSHGCEGGEYEDFQVLPFLQYLLIPAFPPLPRSVPQMTERVDRVIRRILELQCNTGAKDIVIVLLRRQFLGVVCVKLIESN
ncbi:hypothetical protein NLG97_g10715 [Lecanicillium saksenae]|uniref:Uncharacterized protein n=1 Tax=Lecanicillium saksenae TaxID=468837 RepID=A0ACC1QFD6_9HYPO|nr:hypothetical protein NLG97_g10715 [Lecanicillium saksenae]